MEIRDSDVAIGLETSYYNSKTHRVVLIHNY